MKDGRNSDGTFAHGNTAAAGGEGWKKVSALRAAALNCTSEEQVEKVLTKLCDLAIEGDTRAAQIWLDRIGLRPEAVDLEERISALEAMLEEQLGGVR